MYLLKAPKVVDSLNRVCSTLDHVPKLVACALQLLAVELHDGKGVVVQELDLRTTRRTIR